MKRLILSLSLFLIALSLQAQQRSSCSLPLKPVNVSHPTTVVGTGTPDSCTEQALQAAVAAGGIITFNCGAIPAVINLTTQHEFRNDMDTVVDGGNKITLKGNGSTRLFFAKSGDAPWHGGTPPYYQSTHTAITFPEHHPGKWQVERDSASPLPPAPHPIVLRAPRSMAAAASSMCKIWCCTSFIPPSLAIMPRRWVPTWRGVASMPWDRWTSPCKARHFQNNDGANGGAIGMLESNFQVVNSVFQSNQALGHDGNHNIPSSGCPLHDNQYQVGDGGNAGAVYLDGQDTAGPLSCGNLFTQNNAGTNAIGGAIFGAGDPGTQDLTIIAERIRRKQQRQWRCCLRLPEQFGDQAIYIFSKYGWSRRRNSG